MKKLIHPSDFEYFNSQTERVVAATIANDQFEQILKTIIRDTTQNSNTEFAQGYRAAIVDILRKLEE